MSTAPQKQVNEIKSPVLCYFFSTSKTVHRAPVLRQVSFSSLWNMNIQPVSLVHLSILLINKSSKHMCWCSGPCEWISDWNTVTESLCRNTDSICAPCASFLCLCRNVACAGSLTCKAQAKHILLSPHTHSRISRHIRMKGKRRGSRNL